MGLQYDVLVKTSSTSKPDAGPFTVKAVRCVSVRKIQNAPKDAEKRCWLNSRLTAARHNSSLESVSLCQWLTVEGGGGGGGGG